MQQKQTQKVSNNSIRIIINPKLGLKTVKWKKLVEFKNVVVLFIYLLKKLKVKYLKIIILRHFFQYHGTY